MNSFKFAPIAVAALLALSPLVARAEGTTTETPAPEHKEAEAHPKHKHGKKCGHKAEEHTTADGKTHTDYEHNGHHHKQDGKHYDECTGPEADAATAKPEAKKAE